MLLCIVAAEARKHRFLADLEIPLCPQRAHERPDLIDGMELCEVRHGMSHIFVGDQWRPAAPVPAFRYGGIRYLQRVWTVRVRSHLM